MDHITMEAQRLAQLAQAGALSFPVILSVLTRIEQDARAKGLSEAASPVMAISQEIDRRMAQLGLDGLDDQGA